MRQVTGMSEHHHGDLYMNMGVIAALVLSGPMGFVYADPILGLVVVAILAKSAWDIFSLAADQLMDRELDDDIREEIKQIILSHPQVLGLHDLRTRLADLPSTVVPLGRRDDAE